jgi:hypothetical protein
MPKHPKKSLETAASARGWAQRELATLCLGDQRVEKRLQKILTDFVAQPEASIPRASEDWAATKGAYRFFDNEAVAAPAVLAAHRQACVARARGAAVVLAVQDTTTLNFSTHPQTVGLGPAGNNRDKTIGLLLHSTLLLAEDGQALGLIDTQLQRRDPARFKAGPVSARNRQPVEQKESVKWLRSLEASVRTAQELPGTVLINIADRESDSYDLFWRHHQLRAGEGGAAALNPEAAARVELLVRCRHDRQLSQPQERLFAHLAAQPVVGSYGIAVPRQPGKKARSATLSIRCVEVTLPPPADQRKYQGHDQPLSLWALQAREENPPLGQTAICWRLLSTLPVTDLKSAQRQVQRSSRRWEIEVFHKILKSGCKAEERQLETVTRLERCLALDAIVAYRVLALSKAARTESDQPLDQWLAEHEWKALWCRVHRRSDPPSVAPPTHQATRWIAQLGGFLARKGDGHPGPMTLWRGLQRLNDIAEAYLLFTQTSKDVGNA